MKQLQFAVNIEPWSFYKFEVDDDVEPVLVESFVKWLDGVFGSGMAIEDGMELLYGWAIIRCKVSADCLLLSTADVKKSPPTFTNNLTPALNALVYHQFVPESFGLNCDIPGMTDTVLVGEKYNRMPMFLTRSEKSGDNHSHSGWFMASLSHDADIAEEEKLKIMTIYEAVTEAPHILKYISLPVGSQVMFESAQPSFHYMGKPIEPTHDSLVSTDQQLSKA